jgi:8-oxo-dGTP pyrophosphatase MutT (NUDIX family)
MARTGGRFIDALREGGGRGQRRHAEGGRRAAIAAIFRHHPVSGVEQVLFIRRAVSPRDPWSGNVALPGGRQDPADGLDDEATAIRETREEVGLDLTAAGWERLGRLVDDRIIHAAGRKMAVAMLGFAARDASCVPSLALQPSEVADAWWVDTHWIDAAHLDWRRVELRSMMRGLRERPLASALLRCLGLDTFKFAAIALPPPPAADAPADALAAAQPLPHTDARRSHFELWGLTLGFFSDVLRTSRAGQPLVGDGAPRVFAIAFIAASDGLVPRTASRVLEQVRVYGARTAAMRLGASLALAVGVVGVGVGWLAKRSR